MKVHIEMDVTPDEARKLFGLPDIGPMQSRMMEEIERRMSAAVAATDPQAMLRAWLPVGGPALEQFQRFLWDSVKAPSSKSADADKPKSTS